MQRSPRMADKNGQDSRSNRNRFHDQQHATPANLSHSPGSSHLQTSSFPNQNIQNVLMTISPPELTSQSMNQSTDIICHLFYRRIRSGFLQVKTKVAQLLERFDFSNRISQDVALHNLENVALGGKTLREIGGAIIERDPHSACINKVFDDLWHFGFSKMIRLSFKLEESSNTAELTTDIQLWRKNFLASWIGALCKVQDTLSLYKNPRSVLQIIPSLQNFLPPGYMASNETTASLLYQLPINYLLRDLALCLARIHSYEDKELEKVWMDRAHQLSLGISGRRYKDAWEHLKRGDGRIQNQADMDSLRSGDVYSGVVIGSQQTSTQPQRQTFAQIVTHSATYGDALKSKSIFGADHTDFGAKELLPCQTIQYNLNESSPCVGPEPAGHEYGAVTATLDDLAILKPFVSRNSFLQGLLQGAESQGLIKTNIVQETND